MHPRLLGYVGSWDVGRQSYSGKNPEINPRSPNYAWTVESRRALVGSCNHPLGVAYPIH